MNGNTATLLVLEPPVAPVQPEVQDKSDPEVAGQAVADAAIMVCKAMLGYRQTGRLNPAIKDKGGTAIAAVARLMLDATSDDDDFINQARNAARFVLRRRFTDGDDPTDPTAADAAINMAINSVFEIVVRVVRDERTIRRAWAN